MKLVFQFVSTINAFTRRKQRNIFLCLRDQNGHSLVSRYGNTKSLCFVAMQNIKQVQNFQQKSKEIDHKIVL